MSQTTAAVQFDYVNRQGRFLIHYGAMGNLRILAYGRPEDEKSPLPYCRDGVDESQERARSYSMVHYGHHSMSLLDVIDQQPHDELVDLCRRNFLEKVIRSTRLEPPEAEELDSLSFPVRMWTGGFKKVYLLGNGRGYLLDKVNWLEQIADRLVTYAAPFPHAWFRHSVDQAAIIRDADIIDSGGEPSRILASQYEELFWSALNPQMTQPWIRTSEEIADTGLTIEGCTLEELEALLADVVRLDDRYWRGIIGNQTLNAFSATDESPAAMPVFYGNNKRLSHETSRLAHLILKWAKPYGYVFQNDDVKPENWSSYTKRPIHIKVRVEEPSATERLEALERLLCWAENAGVDIEPHLPS